MSACSTCIFTRSVDFTHGNSWKTTHSPRSTRPAPFTTFTNVLKPTWSILGVYVIREEENGRGLRCYRMRQSLFGSFFQPSGNLVGLIYLFVIRNHGCSMAILNETAIVLMIAFCKPYSKNYIIFQNVQVGTWKFNIYVLITSLVII